MEPKQDPQKELEIQLGELEERVDRLRALYEQYFMGFEKMEPGVQRRDVERRFAVLRKTQIRNTAQRYRFNVITQKHSVYSMYWTRVCRQIEEGTFKRHVARAKRKFGEGAVAGKRRDEDWASIEVDLGDFDEDDMEAILAEADAAAEAHTNARGGGAADTVPPAVVTQAVDEDDEPETPKPMPAPKPQPLSTPIRITSRQPQTNTAPLPFSPMAPPNQPAPGGPAGQQMRAARPAPLPIGAKPRIMLRKKDEAPAPAPVAPPPAAPPPAAPIETPSREMKPAARPPGMASPHIAKRTGSQPDQSPPSTRMRPAAPSHPDHPPPSVRARPALPSSGDAHAQHGPPSTSVIRAADKPAPKMPAPSERKLPLPLPTSAPRIAASPPASTSTPDGIGPPSDPALRASRRAPPALPSQIKKS